MKKAREPKNLDKIERQHRLINRTVKIEKGKKQNLKLIYEDKKVGLDFLMNYKNQLKKS